MRLYLHIICYVLNTDTTLPHRSSSVGLA